MKASISIRILSIILILAIFLSFLLYVFRGEDYFSAVAEPILTEDECRTNLDCTVGKCLRIQGSAKKCGCLYDDDCGSGYVCNIENECRVLS